jgi:phosphatidylglycerol---prolipoprotein diacylglyceryl transferase
MLPVLQVGPLAIQTYPLALLLAGWAALAVGSRLARYRGIDGDHVYNAGLYGLIGGVIAARAGHVIAYWSAYRTQLTEIFGFNTQAFLLWPGLIGGLAIAGWYIYRHRLPLVAVLDVFAPGALVGVAIASIGAFLAGRNPGAASSLPWAVEMWGVTRHPSQLYEALAALAVAGLAGQSVRRGARPGAPFLLAVLGYGLSRWLLEPFREASPALPGTGLRVPQVIGLALALVSLWALTRPQALTDSEAPASSSPADEDQPPLSR